MTSTSISMIPAGMVYLVGAGPGDPQLITLLGVSALARADVVLYDYLVNPDILRHAKPSAHLICLGRHGRASLWAPEAICERLVAEARRGHTVVRLKCGDPMVFGRAAAEIEHLAREGVRLQVIPGITAALAAPSYAAIPVTDRHHSSAVAFVTGQETSGKDGHSLDYKELARFPGTLVIYMGVTTAVTWTRQLMDAGVPTDRPVALIRRCSWPNQQIIRCRLDEVADRVTPYAKFPPPVIAIVGEVAGALNACDWFQQRPLWGQTVVVTRPRDQSLDLQQRLADLGAEVLVQPAIRICDPPDWQSMDDSIRRLQDFDDVVFSSSNGVDYFLRRLIELGFDIRSLSNARLAAVGPATSQTLASYHLRVDVQPTDRFSADSLVESLAGSAAGRRMLLVSASRGRELLADRLRSAGATVELLIAYQSLDVHQLTDDVADRLANVTRPWITVTSSSIARASVRLLKDVIGVEPRWASISPLTSQALREAGAEPTCEARSATLDSLVDAIVASCGDDPLPFGKT